MTATAASLGERRRRDRLVLPDAPTYREKWSYTWRSLPFLTSALVASSMCVIAAQAWFEIRNPAALPFAAYTFLYFAYQAVSVPMNFAGPNFHPGRHRDLVARWRPAVYPSVDIFLPICGEPIEVLRNTWIGVFELIHAYPGSALAYVLDDGPSEEARFLARSFGFGYVRRPELRYHKKAGNLNYAFARTDGEHVVIFDADFRPRADFLDETLPYLDDPEIGLVQTPQFFRVHPGQTWVEQAAGASLEVFYRVVQVSRDRFGSALCVGSNAVYRREALEKEGGFTLRLPYVAGWLWNLLTGLRTLVIPLFPITLLIFLPGAIALRNALLLIPAIVVGAVLYPLWHTSRYPLSMWPLAIATGWAQLLAIWDYARGKVMSWQPSRGPGDATRRFRKAVLVWNGGLALAWLLLAGWRIAQAPSPRFAAIAALGIVNAVIVARVIFPGRNAR